MRTYIEDPFVGSMPKATDIMPAKKSTKRIGDRTTARSKSSSVFTDEERAAMREHAREVKAARSSSGTDSGDDETAVFAKLAEMTASDRAMGERVHAIIKASAPELTPKLWYGMPAYAKNGTVVCFFQPAKKFKTRYSTLGFSDKAALDDGQMWPTSFALAELTAEDEATIGALVKRAAS